MGARTDGEGTKSNRAVSMKPDSDIGTRADIEPILKEIVEVLVREYKKELINTRKTTIKVR